MGDERRHRMTPDERAFVETTGPLQREEPPLTAAMLLERLAQRVREKELAEEAQK